MELEAAKLKNYLMKKERGQLKCSQVGAHTHALQYLPYCLFFFFFPSLRLLPLLAAPSHGILTCCLVPCRVACAHCTNA